MGTPFWLHAARLRRNTSTLLSPTYAVMDCSVDNWLADMPGCNLWSWVSWGGSAREQGDGLLGNGFQANRAESGFTHRLRTTK